MIKALLMDADGVLINGEMFSTHLLRDHGLASEMTAPFFQGPFADCIVGKADLKQVILPYLEQWGWTKGADAFLAYWFQSEHHLNQPLIDTLQELRHCRLHCYVATNQEIYRVEYMRQSMGFDTLFDHVFASAHLGCRKPDHAFYAALMAALDPITHDEVLLWDDTLANVEAARRFGIHAEQYQSLAHFETTIQQYLDA